MLLITDGHKPMAIAGVMGRRGKWCERQDHRVVFESANFDPVSVRKTSAKLGLRSESSARFEKSLDSELCELALKRAVELMIELSPAARVASKVVDEYPRPQKPIVVTLSPSLVNDRLGTNIPVVDMKDILERLGFTVETARRLPPSPRLWRAGKAWGYQDGESRVELCR